MDTIFYKSTEIKVRNNTAFKDFFKVAIRSGLCHTHNTFVPCVNLIDSLSKEGKLVRYFKVGKKDVFIINLYTEKYL